MVAGSLHFHQVQCDGIVHAGERGVEQSALHAYILVGIGIVLLGGHSLETALRIGGKIGKIGVVLA